MKSKPIDELTNSQNPDIIDIGNITDNSEKFEIYNDNVNAIILHIVPKDLEILNSIIDKLNAFTKDGHKFITLEHEKYCVNTYLDAEYYSNIFKNEQFILSSKEEDLSKTLDFFSDTANSSDNSLENIRTGTNYKVISIDKLKFELEKKTIFLPIELGPSIALETKDLGEFLKFTENAVVIDDIKKSIFSDQNLLKSSEQEFAIFNYIHYDFQSPQLEIKPEQLNAIPDIIANIELTYVHKETLFIAGELSLPNIGVIFLREDKIFSLDKGRYLKNDDVQFLNQIIETMAKTKQEEVVQGTTEEKKKVEKKAYMPLSELIGQKSNEIFGVPLNSLHEDEKKRLEKGLMTDKVYQLTLPDGKEVPGKIQLSKNFKEDGGVLAMYKPQYEKAYIPQKTFDGYQFSMDEQQKLRNGENVLYKVKTKNGAELTKIAKLDLQKGEKDVNYTNQLVIADITRLPIDKITYDQKLNQEQLINFLNGKGVEIENPKIGDNQHQGKMTLFFDPIQGGSRYNADSTLKESFKVSAFMRENKKIEQTKEQKKQVKPSM